MEVFFIEWKHCDIWEDRLIVWITLTICLYSKSREKRKKKKGKKGWRGVKRENVSYLFTREEKRKKKEKWVFFFQIFPHHRHHHHAQCITLIENYSQSLGREERRQLIPIIPIKENVLKSFHLKRNYIFNKIFLYFLSKPPKFISSLLLSKQWYSPIF